MKNNAFRIVMSTVAVGLVVLVSGCGDDDSAGPKGDAGNDVVDATGDTDTPDSGSDGSSIPRQGMIDRTGRPLVALTMVSAAKQDAYNSIPTFSPAEAFTPFDIDFQTALTRYDQIDGTDSWNGGGLPPSDVDGGTYSDGGSFLTHPLGALLERDVLLLDTAKPFSQNGYLDLENEIVGGPAHQTSGGRSLGEDALDVMVSYLATKQRTGLSDGVSAPTKPATLVFPYLAPPN